MSKLRTAIIGSGQIAQVTHIPNYQSMEHAEIAGICDTNIDTARIAAEKFGIKNYYDSHRTMLEELKPDAVIICVPNKFHCSITLEALELGCHVFCEKPPAITAEEAEKMAAKAKEKGKILSFGFHFRASEHIAFLKNRIAAGKMGTIYHTEVKWHRRRGIPGWGCFTNKEIQGGGPLIDIGAHMLDCALYLLDYPEISYVCASSSDRIGKTSGVGLMGAWNPGRFTVEDGIFGYVRFADVFCHQPQGKGCKKRETLWFKRRRRAVSAGNLRRRRRTACEPCISISGDAGLAYGFGCEFCKCMSRNGRTSGNCRAGRLYSEVDLRAV